MNAPKIHTLKNGLTLILTSPGHGARFSDGTVCEAQHPDVCDRLTCRRTTREVGEFVPGMKKVELRMILGEDQLFELEKLSSLANIVMIPFPVLTALREQGVRDRLPNAVAGIATAETQRSAPADKVWDVTQWSY